MPLLLLLPLPMGSVSAMIFSPVALGLVSQSWGIFSCVGDIESSMDLQKSGEMVIIH
jgi:hypothetical protein